MTRTCSLFLRQLPHKSLLWQMQPGCHFWCASQTECWYNYTRSLDIDPVYNWLLMTPANTCTWDKHLVPQDRTSAFLRHFAFVFQVFGKTEISSENGDDNLFTSLPHHSNTQIKEWKIKTEVATQNGTLRIFLQSLYPLQFLRCLPISTQEHSRQNKCDSGMGTRDTQYACEGASQASEHSDAISFPL